jgi:hypothetical protein
VQPTTKVLEVLHLAAAGQTQFLRAITYPRHFCTTLLRQVVAQSHVLAEILHGTFHHDTGFIESDHNPTMSKTHIIASLKAISGRAESRNKAIK